MGQFIETQQALVSEAKKAGTRTKSKRQEKTRRTGKETVLLVRRETSKRKRY